MRTRTKHYLLSLLGALVVAGGVLALTPSAQAQQTPPQCSPSESLCIDKAVTPNPVQVGQTLTFEIELTERIGITLVEVTDVLPPSVEFVSVSPPPPRCNLVDNTVECSLILVRSETITIEVIPRECGTFTNTASAETPTQTVSDTEEFTVEGCEGAAPGQQQEPVCPPVSQEEELGQEAQSGDVDLLGEVTGEADNANQSVPTSQFANSGNNQNAQGVVQSCSEAEDIQLEGGSITLSPELETGSDQTIGQSSASDP